jgi:hypothetical protein
MQPSDPLRESPIELAVGLANGAVEKGLVETRVGRRAGPALIL